MGLNFEAEVDKVLSELKKVLLDKNKKYGNSAIEPLRIFSKLGRSAGLKVRIDDKLSRINNGSLDNNNLSDLINYLILLKISKEEANLT